jgi:hypothetical protein
MRHVDSNAALAFVKQPAHRPHGRAPAKAHARPAAPPRTHRRAPPPSRSAPASTPRATLVAVASTGASAPTAGAAAAGEFGFEGP